LTSDIDLATTDITLPRINLSFSVSDGSAQDSRINVVNVSIVMETRWRMLIEFKYTVSYYPA